MFDGDGGASLCFDDGGGSGSGPVIRGVIYLIYGLIVMFLFRLVTRSIVRFFAAPADVQRRARRPGPRAAEDLVRDPICNTYVPRSRALAAFVQGHEEHFCSEACRDRARATATRAS